MRQGAKSEILKSRKLDLELSSSVCDNLLLLCGRHNITVAELLESFINDLVDGECSNGSDERRLAEEWFDRCYFSWDLEETLLRYLIRGYDAEEFIMAIDYVEELKDKVKDASCEDEAFELLGEMEREEEYIEMIKGEYLEMCPGSDWEKEIAKVREWIIQKYSFKGE